MVIEVGVEGGSSIGGGDKVGTIERANSKNKFEMCAINPDFIEMRKENEGASDYL